MHYIGAKQKTLGGPNQGLLKRAATRMGGFTVSVVITGLTGLMTIPIVVASAGSGVWASMAVGQTIGVIATVLIAFGWAQLGPTEIARADQRSRALYYKESLIVRLFAYVLASPGIVFISLLLSPGDRLITVISALGTAMLAVGGAWYFIGASEPISLLLVETLPRAVSAWIGTAITFASGTGVPAAVGLAIGPLAAVCLSAITIRRRNGPADRSSIRSIWASVRRQVNGIGIGVFSTIYQSMPLLIVSAALPQATATYALGDRIRQQAMTAVTPVAQSAQGWVPRAKKDELRRRVTSMRNIALLLAVAGAALFCAVMPFAAHLLGAGEVHVGWGLTIPFGITFGVNTATLIIGNACLLPLGKSGAVAASAIAGTVVITASLIVFAVVPSEVTIAVATSVAQMSVLTIQLLSLQRALSVRASHAG